MRRKYRRAGVETPYAHLKFLSGAMGCPKDRLASAEQDRTALAVSDLDAVRRVNDAHT